tara:strand:- start:161 stop:517 length:357 start_codon:yes stop_codon:yes gene_type:complete
MFLAGLTHIYSIIENGFMSYKKSTPIFSQILWESLTFFDLLAAILLITKPKIGLYLTLIILVIDIIHNNIFYIDELYYNNLSLNEWVYKYWKILGQIIFGAFVFITFKKNIQEIKKTT